MESRRHLAAHKRNRSLKDNAGASDSVHASLPNIAALIADGEITQRWPAHIDRFPLGRAAPGDIPIVSVLGEDVSPPIAVEITE